MKISAGLRKAIWKNVTLTDCKMYAKYPVLLKIELKAAIIKEAP